MSETEDYNVALDVYNGPLDLLLFLIKREEVDIYDIPLALIIGQYMEYVNLLRKFDPDVISEFLVLAATLMEIKSRMLLPTPPPEEVDEEMIDPRAELVRQLLAYKMFKDAARSLEQSAQIQSLKHTRHPVFPKTDPDEMDLDHVDIWDLFDAFNQMLKQIGKSEAVHQVDVDDTPLTLHIEDIVDSLERADGQQPFEEIFMGRSKGEMIGLFLALLELIRRHRVRAVQDRPFGVISLQLMEEQPADDEAKMIERLEENIEEIEVVKPVIKQDIEVDVQKDVDQKIIGSESEVVDEAE